MKPAFQIDNTQTRTEKILLVCVNFPHISDFNIAVAEAVELVKAVDGYLRKTVTCKRDKPHSALFVGTGKAEELAEIVAINQIDLVIFNHELSPTQERNLEKVLHCRVLDRVGLILAIFAQRAQTPEAKLQVEAAQLTHLSARLIRGYGHLQSQRGGIGLKGPGETQLELDRRLIGQKIVRLNKRLAEVKKNRAVQRQNRRRNKMPVFALVGYTNVGKSTLFNALTKSDVLVKNQLFATLDTTARRLWLSPECSIILTDTVGFVRDLPHSLIDAFSATLEETANADILLHIIDISDKNYEEKADKVEQTLHEIGAIDIPKIKIFNKIDQISNTKAEILRNNNGLISAVRISAIEPQSIELLRQALSVVASELKGQTQ
ncbi:MAG: GTPase HflX [Neisseriaceae bacterium]|nr:GTPase HflX [Neisseriaceae bacterium]